MYSLLSRCIHTIMFQQVSVMQDNNYFYLYFFLLKCDIRCTHPVARCRRVTSCLCFFVSGLSQTRSSSRDPHPLHTFTHGSTRGSGITLDLTNDALIRLYEVRRPPSCFGHCTVLRNDANLGSHVYALHIRRQRVIDGDITMTVMNCMAWCPSGP